MQPSRTPFRSGILRHVAPLVSLSDQLRSRRADRALDFSPHIQTIQRGFFERFYNRWMSDPARGAAVLRRVLSRLVNVQRIEVQFDRVWGAEFTQEVVDFILRQAPRLTHLSMYDAPRAFRSTLALAQAQATVTFPLLRELFTDFPSVSALCVGHREGGREWEGRGVQGRFPATTHVCLHTPLCCQHYHWNAPSFWWLEFMDGLKYRDGGFTKLTDNFSQMLFDAFPAVEYFSTENYQFFPRHVHTDRQPTHSSVLRHLVLHICPQVDDSVADKIPPSVKVVSLRDECNMWEESEQSDDWPTDPSVFRLARALLKKQTRDHLPQYEHVEVCAYLDNCVCLYEPFVGPLFDDSVGDRLSFVARFDGHEDLAWQDVKLGRRNALTLLSKVLERTRLYAGTPTHPKNVQGVWPAISTTLGVLHSCPAGEVGTLVLQDRLRDTSSHSSDPWRVPPIPTLQPRLDAEGNLLLVLHPPALWPHDDDDGDDDSDGSEAVDNTEGTRTPPVPMCIKAVTRIRTFFDVNPADRAAVGSMFIPGTEFPDLICVQAESFNYSNEHGESDDEEDEYEYGTNKVTFTAELCTCSANSSDSQKHTGTCSCIDTSLALTDPLVHALTAGGKRRVSTLQCHVNCASHVTMQGGVVSVLRKGGGVMDAALSTTSQLVFFVKDARTFYARGLAGLSALEGHMTGTYDVMGRVRSLVIRHQGTLPQRLSAAEKNKIQTNLAELFATMKNLTHVRVPESDQKWFRLVMQQLGREIQIETLL